MKRLIRQLNGHRQMIPLHDPSNKARYYGDLHSCWSPLRLVNFHPKWYGLLGKEMREIHDRFLLLVISTWSCALRTTWTYLCRKISREAKKKKPNRNPRFPILFAKSGNSSTKQKNLRKIFFVEEDLDRWREFREYFSILLASFLPTISHSLP